MSNHSSDQDLKLLDLLYDELEDQEAEQLREALESDPQLRETLHAWASIQAMTRHLEEFEPDPQTHYDILREARLSEAESSSVRMGFWDRMASVFSAPAFAVLAVAVFAGALFNLMTDEIHEDASIETASEESRTPSETLSAHDDLADDKGDSSSLGQRTRPEKKVNETDIALDSAPSGVEMGAIGQLSVDKPSIQDDLSASNPSIQNELKANKSSLKTLQSAQVPSQKSNAMVAESPKRASPPRSRKAARRAKASPRKRTRKAQVKAAPKKKSPPMDRMPKAEPFPMQVAEEKNPEVYLRGEDVQGSAQKSTGPSVATSYENQNLLADELLADMDESAEVAAAAAAPQSPSFPDGNLGSRGRTDSSGLELGNSVSERTSTQRVASNGQVLVRAKRAQAEGRHRDAIRSYEQYLATAPTRGAQTERALFEAAQSYRALGQETKAGELFRLAARGESVYAARARQALKPMRKARSSRKSGQRVKREEASKGGEVIDFESAEGAE